MSEGNGRIDLAEINLGAGGLDRVAEHQFRPMRDVDPSPRTWGSKRILSLCDRPLEIAKDTWQIPATWVD